LNLELQDLLLQPVSLLQIRECLDLLEDQWPPVPPAALLRLEYPVVPRVQLGQSLLQKAIINIEFLRTLIKILLTDKKMYQLLSYF
jgi:hypothetical protein